MQAAGSLFGYARECRVSDLSELGFDILLTGHQHMSVPGQMVQGTFVVQPSDKGQEFLKVEAAVSDDGAQFSSRTIHAGGPCPEWLAEFSGMERGAQDWLDEVVGHLPEPMTIDTPAAYGRLWKPASRSV